MKLHLGLALAGVLGVGTWGGLARADEKPITDEDFLVANVIRSAYQVKAGSLALTRSKEKGVQQFARAVIAQQGKFDADLNTLAVNFGIPVRSNQKKGRQLSDSRLATLQDDRFDREFLRLLVQDLEVGIDLAQRCADGSGGAAVRDLAARMLPALRQRLRDANRLLKTVR
jgi:predicted outer membrane protein